MVIASKAEEGISGLLPLDRRPEPMSEELIGGTLSPQSIAMNMQDVKIIDLEGRTTMLDLGLFVLINLYCPNETNEDRLDFKLAFNAMLEARIINLIKAGREVVAVGDINICARPIDHCDPVRRASESPYGGFEHHPARKWFNELVGERGSLVDLGRHFYPERKSMFTHWETRINARETNYGTRIDYILATPGLLPWIRTCEIVPHILGSDHCPVIADFHDSISTSNGETLYLWDLINAPGRCRNSTAAEPEAPRLAAKFYPEFSSEQRLLSNFFGKRPSAAGSYPPLTTDSAPTTRSPVHSASTAITPDTAVKAFAASAPTSASSMTIPVSSSSSLIPPRIPLPSPSIASSNIQSPSIDLTLNITDEDSSSSEEGSTVIATTPRSPSVADSSNGGAKLTKKKVKKGQQTLARFFKPPPPSPPLIVDDRTKRAKTESKKKGKRKALDQALALEETREECKISNVEERNGDKVKKVSKRRKGSPLMEDMAEEDALREVRNHTR